MAFISTQAKELQAQEQKCLDRVEARTKKVMAEAHLPRGAAYCRAVMELPQTYETYTMVRRQLQALGVPPIIMDGMGLSRGSQQGSGNSSEGDADDDE